MIAYIQEIQRQFIHVWGFPAQKAHPTLPESIWPGCYLMLINGRLDAIDVDGDERMAIACGTEVSQAMLDRGEEALVLRIAEMKAAGRVEQEAQLGLVLARVRV